jgi:sirohydrochlorin cobaltochelatase
MPQPGPMAESPPSAVVLYSHGSRDPAWARPFRRLCDLLAESTPGLDVELAFLESMQPTLTDAIASLARRGAQRVTVIPLFLGQGAHLRRDLPEQVRAACDANPGVVVRTASSVGEMDSVLAAIARWVVDEDAYTRTADLAGPLA